MKAEELSALLKGLNDAQISDPITGKKKPIPKTAKYTTIVILVIAFGFGVFGSFSAANFNMDDYVKFLETFTWFFVPLVISIGAGSVTGNIVKSKSENTKPEAEAK